MKKCILLIIIGVFCFGWFNKGNGVIQATENSINSEPNLENSVGNTKESFEDFIFKFCYDEDFQISRIKFPILYVHLNDDLDNTDSTYTQKNGWKFIRVHLEPNSQIRMQIYDNFNHNLKDTGERVFSIYGIGNGIEEYYYFKRINDLWFMVKYEILST